MSATGHVVKFFIVTENNISGSGMSNQCHIIIVLVLDQAFTFIKFNTGCRVPL